MALSTPSAGASVPERLIAAVIALISEGKSSPSVRQLADRAGRSTMCVYSDFGGRRKLLEAAHGTTSSDLITEMEQAAGAERLEVAERWLNHHVQLAEWLFSSDSPESSRAELIERVFTALGDKDKDQFA